MTKRIVEFGIWTASIMLALWVGYRDGVNDERRDALHGEREAFESMEVRSVELRLDKPETSLRVNVSARLETNGPTLKPFAPLPVHLVDLFQPTTQIEREATAQMLSDVRILLRHDGTLGWELEPWAGIRPIPSEMRFPWLKKAVSP